MKTIKIYPRCHPKPEEISEEDWSKIRKQGPIYSGAGYVLPCCWCDYHDTRDMERHGLLDEELKLFNHSTVESIMLSKQWFNFHNMLLNSPENAPIHCKQRCSSDSINAELNKFDGVSYE
jgi:hypothetical protein